jgi:hypothetical protein
VICCVVICTVLCTSILFECSLIVDAVEPAAPVATAGNADSVSQSTACVVADIDILTKFTAIHLAWLLKHCVP